MYPRDPQNIGAVLVSENVAGREYVKTIDRVATTLSLLVIMIVKDITDTGQNRSKEEWNKTAQALIDSKLKSSSFPPPPCIFERC